MKTKNYTVLYWVVLTIAAACLIFMVLKGVQKGGLTSESWVAIGGLLGLMAMCVATIRIEKHNQALNIIINIEEWINLHALAKAKPLILKFNLEGKLHRCQRNFFIGRIRDDNGNPRYPKLVALMEDIDFNAPFWEMKDNGAYDDSKTALISALCRFTLDSLSRLYFDLLLKGTPRKISRALLEDVLQSSVLKGSKGDEEKLSQFISGIFHRVASAQINKKRKEEFKSQIPTLDSLKHLWLSMQQAVQC